MLEKIGLGVPGITALVMLLRKNGIDISPDIFTSEDAEKALLSLFGGAYE